MSKPQPTFEDLPLRRQKAARTRFALLEALMERLADRQLEEIPVSELAKAAGVSPATFFNYFGSKSDLLTWFIQVWSVQVAAEARRVEAEHDSALRAIEALLVWTARQSRQGGRMMFEVIAHQARMPVDMELPQVELPERLLLLPEEPDVMELPDTGLSGLLPLWLGRAVARGELPPDTSVEELTVAVASIFFGVPLTVGLRHPDAVEHMYLRQLALIWAGARALPEEGR